MKGSEVKVAQLCLTLCHPMDYTVHRILQAQILEWVAFPFSRGSPQPKDRTQVPALGWENPLEKGKATHSSILDSRIPWTV